MPAGLDWDLWLGPAPARPFNGVYVPGPKWYRWWDFGNGTMSDLGSHWNDLPFWALELRAPLTIEAFADRPAHPEIAPATMRVVYEYAARGTMPAVTLTWHQGESKPKIWTDGGIPQWPDAQLFIGDKGMLLSSDDKHVLLPEKDFADFVPPPQTIPEFARALRRVDRRLQGRQALARQLRLRGLADGGQPPRQRRVSRRQEAGVGCRRHEGHQRAGGRAVHQARVSQGLGSHPLVLTSAAANRSVRVPSIVACRPGGNRARSA